jgi:hypothetical protein
MLLLDNHQNDASVLALVLSMPPLERTEQILQNPNLIFSDIFGGIGEII